MTLKEKINADFMTAFKAKDMTKKNYLGLLESEIQSLAGKGIEDTDENVIKIVKKMEKSANEMGTEEALAELEYLADYLPKLMSEDEVREIMTELKSLGGSLNIGMIMGHFNKNFSGQVDNKMVSQLAREFI